MLPPGEILQKEFKTGFRGYEPREVKQFLQLLTEEMQKLLDENNQLKKMLQKCQEVLTEYRDKEETLNNALLSSQKYIDQMRREATKNSEEIILQAQEEARKLLVKEQRGIEQLKKQQDVLRSENRQFMQRIRYILKEHEELLHKFEQENVEPRAEK